MSVEKFGISAARVSSKFKDIQYQPSIPKQKKEIFFFSSFRNCVDKGASNHSIQKSI